MMRLHDSLSQTDIQMAIFKKGELNSRSQIKKLKLLKGFIGKNTNKKGERFYTGKA